MGEELDGQLSFLEGVLFVRERDILRVGFVFLSTAVIGCGRGNDRVSLPAGAIATAIAIGGKTGQSKNPLAVLLCVDNATPTGLLSACP